MGKRAAARVLRANRKKVDAASKQIVALLAKRTRAAAEIARAKRSLGLPITDRRRERAVLKAVAVRAKRAGLEPQMTIRVFREIIKETVRIERKRR